MYTVYEVLETYHNNHVCCTCVCIQACSINNYMYMYNDSVHVPFDVHDRVLMLLSL